MEEPVTGDVQIFLSSKENCLSMRSVGVSSEAILEGISVLSVP
jgi:DNA replication licensing factor MCM5